MTFAEWIRLVEILILPILGYVVKALLNSMKIELLEGLSKIREEIHTHIEHEFDRQLNIESRHSNLEARVTILENRKGD